MRHPGLGERLSKNFVRTFWIVVGLLLLTPVVLFTLIGFGFMGYMPTFEELENPQSSLASEVLADDNSLLGTFYIQNRSFVDYEELAPCLVDALLATEDIRFERHSGVDPQGLGRVFVKTVLLGQSASGGGSTITQQLAKNLFPRDTTHTRSGFVRLLKLGIAKFKEWVTAVKLERNYSKHEILTMYLNTVPFGSNAYGIKMAARTFFNTSPDSLRVHEAAVLVGLVKGPTRYSPVRNPERSLERRNTVLGQMYKYDMLTQTEYDSLVQLPLDLRYTAQDHNSGPAPYFRELLRTMMTASHPVREAYSALDRFEADSAQWASNPLYGWCSKNRKPNGEPYDIYRDGLKIYTNVNVQLQRYAEEAVATHLGQTLQPAFDREKTKSIFSWDVEHEVRDRVIEHGLRFSDRFRSMRKAGASEAEIREAFHVPVRTRLFSWRGEIDTVITPYDSMLYMKKVLRCGFMAIEPKTGRVRAYVGGPNFRHFKYDQVYRAQRQIGSTIKPFLYTLAMQEGYSPCLKVPNVPVHFDMGDTVWVPKNANKTKRDGQMVTLKWGLANSVNYISAWLIKQFSPQALANMIRLMGIHSYIDEVPSIFLGTSLITLFEVTAAYNVFASDGYRVNPMLVSRIEDRNGNLIESFRPSHQEVISRETAYLMVDLLRGVVDHGSALRLRYIYNLQGPLGGKTGTTQNQADGCFMCIHPDIVLGSWVGAEDPQVHFSSMLYGQGAAMALPICGLFLQKAYADPRSGIRETSAWNPPPSLAGRLYDCSGEDTSQDPDDEFF